MVSPGASGSHGVWSLLASRWRAGPGKGLGRLDSEAADPVGLPICRETWLVVAGEGSEGVATVGAARSEPGWALEGKRPSDRQEGRSQAGDSASQSCQGRALPRAGGVGLRQPASRTAEQPNSQAVGRRPELLCPGFLGWALPVSSAVALVCCWRGPDTARESREGVPGQDVLGQAASTPSPRRTPHPHPTARQAVRLWPPLPCSLSLLGNDETSRSLGSWCPPVLLTHTCLHPMLKG
jgi:hypothetical protein